MGTGVVGRSLVLRGAAGLAAAAAVVLVAVALIAGTGRAATNTSHPSPASPATTGVGKAEAVAAVEVFLGRKLVGPDVSGPQDSASGSSYQVMEAGVNAWVDAATGRVTSLLLTPAPETTNMALSPDQAQAAAAAFLTAHSIPFDGLTPAVTVEDHGCCKFYVVTWQRYVNGVTVPDTRIVKLDPSNGTVFNFHDTRQPYGPVASPKIGREEAIGLASTASRLSHPEVGEVQLIVDGGPTFPGRLVWSIQLDDSEGLSHAWVYVDALTGEAKVVGRG